MVMTGGLFEVDETEYNVRESTHASGRLNGQLFSVSTLCIFLKFIVTVEVSYCWSAA